MYLSCDHRDVHPLTKPFIYGDSCSAVNEYQRNNELEVTSAFSQKSKENHHLEIVHSRRSQRKNEMAKVPMLIQKLSSGLLGQAN